MWRCDLHPLKVLEPLVPVQGERYVNIVDIWTYAERIHGFAGQINLEISAAQQVQGVPRVAERKAARKAVAERKAAAVRQAAADRHAAAEHHAAALQRRLQAAAKPEMMPRVLQIRNLAAAGSGPGGV
jgi:hypothetical protein